MQIYSKYHYCKKSNTELNIAYNAGWWEVQFFIIRVTQEFRTSGLVFFVVFIFRLKANFCLAFIVCLKTLSSTSQPHGIVSYGSSMHSFKYLHKNQVLWSTVFCTACSFPAGVAPLMREHKIKDSPLHLSPFQPTHGSKAVGSSQNMIHCSHHPSCILYDHIYHLYSRRLSCWKEPKIFDHIFLLWKPFYTLSFSWKCNLIIICPVSSMGLRNNKILQCRTEK